MWQPVPGTAVSMTPYPGRRKRREKKRRRKLTSV